MKPDIHSHPELMNKIPAAAQKLFAIFGDDIRLVGGSVRDLLLEYHVNDFDFATRYLPEKTIKILQKNNIQAIPTGIKFGTITAVIDHQNFEITTLRQDDKTDGRHCEPVFVDDYYDDAKRRDFTINALYLDAEGQVYDYFSGLSDLKNKEVKFVGDPEERIKEDFLRILRFFRFSAKYSAKLDVFGLKYSIEQKHNLHKLSRERVRAEIVKMLLAKDKKRLLTTLNVMKEKEIISALFSNEIDIKGLETLFEMINQYQLPSNRNLEFATLFWTRNLDIKKFASEICATNLEKKYFYFLSDHLGQNISNQLCFKELLAFFDQDLVLEFYLIAIAKGLIHDESAMIEKNIGFISCFDKPEFPLTSQDIIDLGFEGANIGLAIKRAKLFWAQNNFQNDKETLLNSLK